MKSREGERPSHWDDRINREVAEAVMPRVLAWLKSQGDDLPEGERALVLEQLTHAYDLHDDGYEVAKVLDDRYMWEVDSELVDILGSVLGTRYRAYDKLVGEWVQQHGVAPKYSVGQRVAFRRPYGARDRVTGEVTAVREKTGQYLVFCEAMGHVREDDGKCGARGVYLDFEDVEAA